MADNSNDNTNNEVEGGGAEAESPISPRVRLPTTLRRLPAGHLNQVAEALAILNKVGLNEVGGIGELCSVVSTAASKMTAQTEYGAMCDWGRTPNMWRSAERPDATKACKLAAAAEAGGEASAAAMKERQELEAAQQASWAAAKEASTPGDAEELKKAKKRYCKQIRAMQAKEAQGMPRGGVRPGTDWAAAWWQSMLDAELQLRLSGDAEASWKPSSVGDGSSVLFSSVSQTPQPAGKFKRLAKTIPIAEPKPWSRPPTVSKGAVVTMHLGGAGCGIGLALWERLLSEHGIGPDGVAGDADRAALSGLHFLETKKGRLIPRSVLVDGDAAGLSAAQAAGFFAPDDFISGAGGGNEQMIWPTYTREDFGKQLSEQAMNCLRIHLERVDCVKSIVLTHAVHGAAGGGLADMLGTALATSHSKVIRQTLSLIPSVTSAMETDPVAYNCGLTYHSLMENFDLVTFADNVAMNKICSGTGVGGLGIASPTVQDYNKLLGSVISSWTSPLRTAPGAQGLEGARTLSPKALLHNLVPYPRIHFAMPSLAPLRSEIMSDFSVDAGFDVVSHCFSHGRLCSVEPTEESRHLAIGLCCRGLEQGSAIAAVRAYKSQRSCAFVDYSPTGFVVGSHRDPAAADGGEAVAMINNTMAGAVFEHWAQGLDASSTAGRLEHFDGEGALAEIREDLASIMMDYKDVGQGTE
mmetsp:Transcript_12157/g.26996  ORF Transcript_12157/g.26996 Transcript_12157/m.26996 type:complete len:695 (+) Transcript_12157:66-2150(+)